MSGLIVDNFAGGGGASTGMEHALGRPVDIAINHDREALAVHAANHPGTRHYLEDVFKVDPLEVTQGRPVLAAWFSPDCKHFSKAKGGKPKSKKIRGLAWVMVKWAATVRPAVMFLENVSEFQTWGPLLADGTVCPKRKGKTFRNFVAQLRRLGGVVVWRELRCCDYGAPTIRKRLFQIVRFDGKPIVWPEPTHGAPGSPEVVSGKRKPWRTAAECIDWSIPCPSIFERKRPLAEATMRRIARGIRKFVIEADEPFIVPVTHPGDVRVHGINEPFRTVTGANNHAVVAAHVVRHFGESVGSQPDEPVGTVCAGGMGKTGLVTSHLSKFYGTTTGYDVREPMHTVMGGGNHIAEVRAFLIKYYGQGGQDQDLREPMHTIPAHDRIGLVTIKGEEYVITDIGMRMLEPHELYAAQGFPPDYIIAPMVPDRFGRLRKLPKHAQVRMCGNSVCPPVAKALLEANLPNECKRAEEVAA
jgi:DNA (cytosine-5)-methyltransferase 1